MYTVIPYFYRDAANYKEGSEIVLDGELTSEEVAAIQSKLSEDEFFIPGDLPGLGIEELQPRLQSFPSEDDHVYHTMCLDALKLQSTVPEGTDVISKEDFVSAFNKIATSESWDIEACMTRLDIPV